MTEAATTPETRILIVEDDGIINRHLQSCLLKVGYTIVGTTSSGSEAINLAAQTHPDLILMDISLHGELDGIETAEAIRAWHDIPVIFLTAFADEKTLQRAKSVDPYGYILKPFDQRAVYTTIEMAVHKHQLEKRLRSNEEMLRTLVENQGEGVVIVDPQENFTFVNPAAEYIFNAPANQLMGHNLSEFTSPQTYAQIQEQTQLRRQGHKSIYEIEIIRFAGEKRTISITAAPWFDKQGQYSGAFGILNDITERKRMEDAEREQRTLADALRETATLLSSTLDTNEVLERILETVSRVVPHDFASVLIIEGETVKIIRSQSTAGAVTEEENPHAFPWRKNPFFLHIYQTGSPAYVPGDISLETFFKHRHRDYLNSFLCAPIKVKSQIIGFLLLGSLTPQFYAKKHAERLMAFASQAALAMENARLFDETHQRAQYLSLLNEITQTAIHTSDLSETMAYISRKMVEFFNADGAYITIWNEQQQLSIPAAGYGINQEGYTSIPAKPNERTLTLSVLTTGKTLVVEDIRNTPYIEPELAQTYPFQTMIGLPLVSDEQRLGAIIIGFCHLRTFAKEEIERGEQAARQVALAIAKARFYAEIQRLALTDALTNLLNRRGIFELAQKEVVISQKLNLPLSLLWLDIDHFKLINDQYGHHIGDEVVKEIASRLRGTLRDKDLVGRYGGEGGDEFIILLTETDENNAHQAAERLRANISETPILTGKGPLAVSVSIGVASLSGEINDLSTLLRQADDYMYSAKGAGRDRVAGNGRTGQ